MAEADTSIAAPVMTDVVVAYIAKDIVSAYVANNSLPASDLPALIGRVKDAVRGADGGPAAVDSGPAKATPQEIRKSISHEFLISFEDGKPYKTLRRHLTMRGLTPESYRAKHGLPADYPMVAESYSQARSELAKKLGLGQQSRRDIDQAA